TFNNPTGVAVDSAGIVYVADQSNDTIRKLSPGTRWTVTTLAGTAGMQSGNDGIGTNALFKHPWGIAVDTSGALFITDWANSTIRLGLPFTLGMPALQIAYDQGQVILTWPAALAGYELQTSDRMGPGASWLPVTSGVTKIGAQMVSTNRVAGLSAFYRLELQTATELAEP
ncbi:MAG: hypothetical protein ACREIC_13645, partial [Limisphaerales bacterium]